MIIIIIALEQMLHAQTVKMKAATLERNYYLTDIVFYIADADDPGVTDPDDIRVFLCRFERGNDMMILLVDIVSRLHNDPCLIPTFLSSTTCLHQCIAC